MFIQHFLICTFVYSALSRSVHTHKSMRCCGQETIINHHHHHHHFNSNEETHSKRVGTSKEMCYENRKAISNNTDNCPKIYRITQI